MRVLVVGSGGREHALCMAIAASPLLSKLWCAPGNPGISSVAEIVPIDTMDLSRLVQFARENTVDIVVPGPEAPLVAGLADILAAAGIACCGPTAQAARLEGSKSFTKKLCDSVGIPTARWERFEGAAEAHDFVRRRGVPIVIKADGLAAGKGVVVATSLAEALDAINDLLAKGPVVIEECLTGPEVSLFALCDGTHALPLGNAQDHKRVGDGDIGPNTGGMGAYSPAAVLTPALQENAMARIVRPALAEMARRGTPFRGILFAGLMLTEDGPKLIEFNVRFGDPECQALMLRLKSDLLPALVAACDGELGYFDLRWHDRTSVAVVMAARGYPAAPEPGSVILGISQAAVEGATVFQAGTIQDADGTLRAAGGRVLTICGVGDDLREARKMAYDAVDRINWSEGFCRRDIGAPAQAEP